MPRCARTPRTRSPSWGCTRRSRRSCWPSGTGRWTRTPRAETNGGAWSARFAVQGVAAAPAAILLQLHAVAVVHAILHRRVVAVAALGARHRDLGPVVRLC